MRASAARRADGAPARDVNNPFPPSPEGRHPTRAQTASQLGLLLPQGGGDRPFVYEIEAPSPTGAGWGGSLR